MCQRKGKTAETKKAAAPAQSEKTEAEANEADGEFSEIEVKNHVETAEGADEEYLGHRTANEEAGSIVLHVGHDMNEKEKNDEEADEAAAAKKMLESNEVISKEDMEIRRLTRRGEKNHTQRREARNVWLK